ELTPTCFYDATIFHSMVPHGILQVGDPETKKPQARAKYGTGGFNLGLKPEFSDIPFSRGIIAATLLPNEPDSAGSEFIIIVADQPQFTGKFTAFGHVVEGLEVADKISTTPVDDKQIAKDRIEIRNITIRPRPAPPPAIPPPFSTQATEELSQYRIVMATSKGNSVIEVLPDKGQNH